SPAACNANVTPTTEDMKSSQPRLAAQCHALLLCEVASASDTDDRPTSAALDEAADALLSFGAAMLRAGNTASRTREWMDVLARKLGCDGLSLSLSLDGIIATLRRSGVEATRMREVGAPGANASRLAALEQLAKAARLGVAPREVASRLAEIESAKPAYST